MIKNEMENEYFDWLCRLVCGDKYAYKNSFDELLAHLHRVEFIYPLRKDRNRAEHGLEMRQYFAADYDLGDISDLLTGPCSVLEMMIALAIRMEDIMDDPKLGNRTGQWFWKMIVNLGLGSMTDQNYDEKYVDKILERFLYREYEPDGRGGLFRIKNCEYDLRREEIWSSMLWYLNSVL